VRRHDGHGVAPEVGAADVVRGVVPRDGAVGRVRRGRGDGEAAQGAARAGAAAAAARGVEPRRDGVRREREGREEPLVARARAAEPGGEPAPLAERGVDLAAEHGAHRVNGCVQRRDLGRAVRAHAGHEPARDPAAHADDALHEPACVHIECEFFLPHRIQFNF
jgi:hypothetical protein